MIERFLKNPDTLKRWRKFKSLKRAVIATWLFLFFLFLSVTAELWSNNKPLFMSYGGKWYVPVLTQYHPSELNLKTHLKIIDYRTLNFSKGDWAVWPLIKWDPFESNVHVESYPAPPSKDNWLGTDDRGRDVFSRLIYGFRYSIGFALMVWLFSYIIGSILGAGMGFVGGKLDLIGQRGVEIIEVLPFLLILITLVDLIGGASLWLLVIFMVCFKWINISYYMRAEFLKWRKFEFVDVCRVQGVKPFRIMFKHILPNSLTPILTFSPFSIALSISTLAMLDYLGFGLTPPTPSWGELLLQGEKHFTTAWWLALFPSLVLFIILFVLILIGDGFKNSFDSRKA